VVDFVEEVGKLADAASAYYDARRGTWLDEFCSSVKLSFPQHRHASGAAAALFGVLVDAEVRSPPSRSGSIGGTVSWRSTPSARGGEKSRRSAPRLLQLFWQDRSFSVMSATIWRTSEVMVCDIVCFTSFVMEQWLACFSSGLRCQMACVSFFACSC